MSVRAVLGSKLFSPVAMILMFGYFAFTAFVKYFRVIEAQSNASGPYV